MPLNLSSLKTQVTTRKYGVLRLRPITLEDSAFIAELAAQEMELREFAVRLLHHQLETPQLGLNEVRAWPHRLLARVARAWAASPFGLNHPLPARAPVLRAFRQAAAAHLDDHRRMLEEIQATFAASRQRMMEQLSLPNFAADHLSLLTVEPVRLGLITPNLGAIQSYVDALPDYSAMWQAARDAADIGGRLSEMVGQASAMADAQAQIAAASRWIPVDLRIPDLAGVLQAIPRLLLSDFFLGDQGLFTVARQMAGWFSNQITIAQGVLDQVRGSLTALVNFLPQAQELFRSLTSRVEDLLPKLPDMSGIARWLQAYAQGRAVLAAAGFEFSEELWSPGFLVRLGRIPLKMAAPLVTLALLAITKTPQFEEELLAIFMESRRLRRRRREVKEALAAHCRREYTGSIRNLLAEVEGVFGEIQQMHRRVKFDGHKVLELDAQGQVKTRQKRNKVVPVEVNGLGELVQRWDYSTSDDLHPTVRLIDQHLAKARNPIQHGRRPGFASAKLSTMALLALMILARRAAEMEAARTGRRN